MAHVCRVLLVDDEVEFVTTLAERLQTRGLDVSTACDGQRGLDLIEQIPFDAVVLDIMMPGIDGMETLKRMLEQQPNLQIVMLTGHAQLEQGIAAVKAGAADYLEKPIQFARLLDKINEAREKTAALKEEQAEQDIDDIMKRKGW